MSLPPEHQVHVHVDGQSDADVEIAQHLVVSSDDAPSKKRPAVVRAGTSVLADRVRAMLGEHRRVLVGLAGPPGAGKSTLAAALADALHDVHAVVVPFDGFHLANNVLADRHLSDRKGALETFDTAGYSALLQRLSSSLGTVYAPMFDRSIEQPVAGAIAVEPDCRVVITEGNYLLVDEFSMVEARQTMTEVWYVDLDEQTRLDRLEHRHIAHGKTPEQARSWTRGTDQANADIVGSYREAADLQVIWAS